MCDRLVGVMPRLAEQGDPQGQGLELMALIACSECGKEISDKAPSCPHCGVLRTDMATAEAPTPAPSGGAFSGVFKTILSFVVGSYVLTYGLNWLSTGTPPHPVRLVTDLLREVGVPVGNLDCDSIHPEVISVSVDSAAKNDGIAIRDIVNISTESQSPTEVSCIGRATWSTGQNSKITYSKTLRGGAYWIEFQEQLF